jgi:hypothetical protein
VTSGVLGLFQLCRELLMERARRATICQVARTLDRGGFVLDMRACGQAVVINVPEPRLAESGSRDDLPAD